MSDVFGVFITSRTFGCELYSHVECVDVCSAFFCSNTHTHSLRKMYFIHEIETLDHLNSFYSVFSCNFIIKMSDFSFDAQNGGR